MAEEITYDQSLTRKERYTTLLPQVKSLVSGEKSLIANMANVAAVIREAFGFHWVGFYLVESADELVLGPFQGPVACTRLRKGKGVCAAAWERAETVIVPDVEAFPGHVACSALSRSEIVVPVFNPVGEVVAVLDIDSSELDDFSTVDQQGLESFCRCLTAEMSA
jgi:GAF domain-containing protein